MNPALFARRLAPVLAVSFLLGCGGGASSGSDSVAPALSLTAPANFATGLLGTLALGAQRRRHIPADNPFFGTQQGLARAIWAYGLRNPFTFAAPPGSGPGGFFTGFSIAGGAFCPATGPFPAPYRGNYFFADFVGRFIGRLDPANGNAAYAFAGIGDAPVDMLVATDGALLVLGRSSVTRISAP